MTIQLLGQMVFMAVLAVVIYTIIGFIPGTDETSVLLPITLVVVLSGVAPIVALTFFVSAIVTLNLVNAIPTALVGLPGGVMSSPMMDHSLYVKKEGRSAEVIKKMAVGSLIGVVISIPISLLLASLLAPYAESLKEMSSLLLLIGAIVLSLLSKQKLLSLVSIIPLAILFMGLRHLYWGIGIVPSDKTITTSFFLGITIGPLIVSLLNLINKDKRKEMSVDGNKEISIPSTNKGSMSLNPFKILTKEEFKNSVIGSVIVNFFFVLSPVGLTILVGETLNNRIKDSMDKALNTITTMSSVIQATYLSGLIIPLMAVGLPLSPVASGPAGALFNAEPVFTLDNNIHHLLSKPQFVIAVVVGALIAISLTYVIINRYASSMSAFVLKKIPHEAILGLFISFIVLLAYMDAGLINVFGVMLIGITCGTLNKMGVNYGIQFMTLYASPFIIQLLI